MSPSSSFGVPTNITLLQEADEKLPRTFLIDRETYNAVRSVMSFIILPSVSALGVFANLANIIVFMRMGFLETTNIMFFALAVSDMIVVTSYVLSAFVGTTMIANINTLFLNMFDLVLLIAPVNWAFIGYGSFVTALIAVERSVCIAFPLKVKTIFTPRRITVSLLCLLTFPLAMMAQRYAITELPRVISPVNNESRIIFTYKENAYIIDVIAVLVFSTIPSWISFIVVAVGTGFMVVKLNESARWRKTSAQGTQKKGVSTKEVKVVRSVVIVCGIFIACFTPNGLLILASLIYPPFHLSDPYFGLLNLVFFQCSHVLQAISSSVNICIYLSTSSKYKETFVQIFLAFTIKPQYLVR